MLKYLPGNLEDFRIADFTFSLIMCFVCICGAALASGLTLSVVSLDAVDLRVKKKWGTVDEHFFADRLLPLTSTTPRHRVLVTLLLCNSLFNEALPTFLSDCMPRLLAVVVAVFSVLIFGEIIPSALCTGPNKLAIASYFTPFLWVLMTAVAPVAVPIAWVLDYLVPADDLGGAASRPGSKQQLMSLVAVQREMARERGDLEPFDQDEENMIRGVLSLSSLTPESAGILRPMEEVFSLPLDSLMNHGTMHEIMERGFSRVPVHSTSSCSDPETAAPVLLGYLLVKDHLLTDPSEARPLRSLTLYTPLCVPAGLSLSALLNEFQDHAGHMAFVAADAKKLQSSIDALVDFWGKLNDSSGSNTVVSGEHVRKKSPTSIAELAEEEARLVENVRLSGIQGIVTLEDIIEVLLTEEVPDEGDRRRNLFKKEHQKEEEEIYQGHHRLPATTNNNGSTSLPFPKQGVDLLARKPEKRATPPRRGSHATLTPPARFSERMSERYGFSERRQRCCSMPVPVNSKVLGVERGGRSFIIDQQTAGHLLSSAALLSEETRKASYSAV